MEYEVFIGGETVGLCVPSNDEFVIKQWSSWLAREEITKYLNAVCLFFIIIHIKNYVGSFHSH